MHYSFKNKGTCSQAVEFDYEDGIVTNVRFIGGCRGNTQGVARLCEGMQATEIITRVEGILCREGTSCPDQLAKALRQVVDSQPVKTECNKESIPVEGADPDCANCPTPCGREKLI